jgi:hypothetical protein
MLDRLGVQQKLSLLLTLPLAALVVTSVPFVVGRIDDAIGARATVDAARAARHVGGLVEDLQQERLLAVAALTTSGTDQSAYVSLIGASADRAHDVNAVAGAELRRAVTDLSALDSVRNAVLKRAAAPAQVQEAYHGRIVALIDALRLTRQAQADTIGLRQTNALDALLRTNEEASRLGAALVVTASDRQVGANLVAEARALRGDAANRFRQYASGGQVALLDLVQRGPNGQRIDQLAAEAGVGNGVRTPLIDVAAAAQTTTTLGRALQERIINDIAVRAQARANSAELAASSSRWP